MRTNEANAVQSPEPLLSAAARVGAALAVVWLLGAGWLYAERESRAAVHASTAELTAIRVTLPRVEVVGRRDAATVAAAAATGAVPRQEAAGKAL